MDGAGARHRERSRSGRAPRTERRSVGRRARGKPVYDPPFGPTFRGTRRFWRSGTPPAMRNPLRIALLVLIVLTLSAGAWFYLNRDRTAEAHVLTLYGNVDIREVQPAFNDSRPHHADAGAGRRRGATRANCSPPWTTPAMRQAWRRRKRRCRTAGGAGKAARRIAPGGDRAGQGDDGRAASDLSERRGELSARGRPGHHQCRDDPASRRRQGGVRRGAPAIRSGAAGLYPGGERAA